MNETIVKQLERERAQVRSGIDRYHAMFNASGVSDTNIGNLITIRAVAPLAARIAELVDDVENGKAGAGRPALAVSYLRALDPEGVAYLTVRTALDGAIREDRLVPTAMKLARAIEDTYNFDMLEQEAPGLAYHMEGKAKKWSTAFHRKAIMRKAVKIAEVKGMRWSDGDKLKLGMKLIELFIEATGLVEMQLVRHHKTSSTYMIRATEQTMEWIKDANGKVEALNPCFQAMLVKPQPWTSAIRGGYISDECRSDLIRDVSNELRDELLSTDLTQVFHAMNAVQDTQWRINKGVYQVLSTCWSEASQIGGLPAADGEPVPERPAHIPGDIHPNDMSEAMLKEFNTWKYAASSAHERNASLRSKRLAVMQQLSLAADLKDEPEFYFPHNLDFRGRLYPIAPSLNPQADDFGKSLLEFAEGKPLGEHGAYWLCVHIANVFGQDKVSFDERVQWVQDNADKILDSAADPLDGLRFWTEADDPWCALAACFEYAGYTLMGDEYVSHLPIAMDGSCSGLQHFSAMLKDEHGGKAVNLTPSDAPQDIYTEVLNEVERLLLKGSYEGDDLLVAQAWRGNVTRKIVKRPCMTYAYSVTARGIHDQIQDELRKQRGAEDTYLPGIDDFHAARVLTPLVVESIENTVRQAAVAMRWLKEAGRCYLNHGAMMSWFTPLGLPVQQRYYKSSAKNFKVWWNGLRIRFKLSITQDELCRRRQASGIAPNFVHSMDATHLMMVANDLTSSGITASYAVIHDSFGVHACDVDELQYSIRNQFRILYSEDQLDNFRKQVMAFVPEDVDVPPTPAMGTLDLDGITDAEYFFS